MRAAGNVLADTTKVLAGVEEGKANLDELLDAGLAHPELRRTVSSTLFFYFRNKRLIDDCLTSLAARPPRPKLRRLLVIALTQICFQDGIAPESAVNVAVDAAKRAGGVGEGKFVNAVLRRAVASPPEILTGPEDVFPETLYRRWKKRYSPEGLEEMATAFLSPAPFTFRAERGFEPGELASKQIPSPEPYRFYEAASAAAVLESEALKEGMIYIQDPATAIAVSLPDMENVKTVLDVCAAPGGKSLMLSERMESGATLIAADRSAKRQELTRENFRKRGLDFKVIVSEPAGVRGEYDLVLADVPCSNTGVFRRRPDALWRFNLEELGRILALQRSILEDAAKRVAPGGQLVYSTCSIEPEENGEQVRSFLKTHPGWEWVEEEELLPGSASDGAYACLLKKSR